VVLVGAAARYGGDRRRPVTGGAVRGSRRAVGLGAAIAVGFAYVLFGRCGGRSAVAAAQGTLGANRRLGPRPRP
jgi:hypothetical protein